MSDRGDLIVSYLPALVYMHAFEHNLNENDVDQALWWAKTGFESPAFKTLSHSY